MAVSAIVSVSMSVHFPVSVCANLSAILRMDLIVFAVDLFFAGQTPLVTLDLPDNSDVALDSIERSTHAKDAATRASRNRPRLASSGRPGSKVNPPLDKLGWAVCSDGRSLKVPVRC